MRTRRYLVQNMKKLKNNGSHLIDFLEKNISNVISYNGPLSVPRNLSSDWCWLVTLY
jgi:hypothetical protein